MIFNELPLKGAYVIDLEKFEDERGFFARFWCRNEVAEKGLTTKILQINNSMSRLKGIVRGLHFQCEPKIESRIIRCIHGVIWDVIVDIRVGSPTYGKWCARELNEETRTMMYVPKGFAHGFQTLTDNVEILYLHSEYYNKKYERGIVYNDKLIDIHWPLLISEISERDRLLPKLIDI